MFEIKNKEKRKLSLSGASSKKQKESSLILRKAKFQAIFKFVLSSASGGAGGGKYNRISAFVSMLVLLIRSSLEKFFKKNFRDDIWCFCNSRLMREITTSGIRPPRDDSAETREIPTKIYDFLGMTAITPPTSALKHLFVMTGIALALALVFTFTSISESFAACNGATATTAGTDEDGAYCGSWDCGAAGSNVTCTLSKGTGSSSKVGAEVKNYKKYLSSV